jgi:hypothetical protein
MDIWAGLKKIYGCSLCGATVKPIKTIQYVKDNTKVDLCQKCWNETEGFPKFKQGIEQKELIVTDF